MITSQPIILNLKTVGLSDEQFYQLCQANEDLRLEQTAQEELVIMPPVGAISFCCKYLPPLRLLQQLPML
jgi:Uma2 family endonuclease